MIDPSMKPLCDQMHGVMTRIDILVGDGDRFPGFQCQNALCGRVFTELNGYRDWVQGKGGGRAKPDDPRCKTHGHYRMYVSDYVDEFVLKYVCPEEGCAESLKIEVGLDELSGFWKKT